MSSATALPPTCSKTAPTSAPCKRCWATPTLQRHRCIRTSPTSISEKSTKNSTVSVENNTVHNSRYRWNYKHLLFFRCRLDIVEQGFHRVRNGVVLDNQRDRIFFRVRKYADFVVVDAHFRLEHILRRDEFCFANVLFVFFSGFNCRLRLRRDIGCADAELGADR